MNMPTFTFCSLYCPQIFSEHVLDPKQDANHWDIPTRETEMNPNFKELIVSEKRVKWKQAL